MSILILSYELHFSENREIGSEYGSPLSIIQQLCHKTDSMLIPAYHYIYRCIFLFIKYFYTPLSSQHAKLFISTHFYFHKKIQAILTI